MTCCNKSKTDQNKVLDYCCYHVTSNLKTLYSKSQVIISVDRSMITIIKAS